MTGSSEIGKSLCLDDFQSMINLSTSVLVKKTRDERETYRIPRFDDMGIKEPFYLKRYLSRNSVRWTNRLIKQKFQKQAQLEWDALQLFSNFNFPVPKPLAIFNSDTESFVLMSEVKSKCTLQSWFQKHSVEQFAIERKDIIEQLAEMTQQMHANHLHHQDYYLGHFLFDQQSNHFSLIDLGRAGQMKMLRKKWIVKDLAQLHYSSIDCWTDQEFSYFLKLYLGHSRCDSLLASILVKSMKIALHSKKHKL